MDGCTALVGIYLLDRDFRKYLILYRLKRIVNCQFLISKFKCVCKLLNDPFPIMGFLSQFHGCIPGSRCHFQCVNEMMDTFLSWVFYKCCATLINMLNWVWQPYVFLTHDIDFFVESNFQQYSTLWPFWYGLLMRTPPSSRRSFLYIV